MNCPKAIGHLPALLYEDLAPELKAPLEEHLANCSACKHELTALRGVMRLLGSVPAPEARIELPQLYRKAALRQERRLRSWRRTAAGITVAAAVMLTLVLGTRLEARVEAHQLVLRWGQPPPLPDPLPLPQMQPNPVPEPKAQVLPVADDHQLRLLSELIRALADRVQTLERQQRRDELNMESQLTTLQDQNSQRWSALDRSIRALYVLTHRGE
jgi:hypothetical protein